MPLVRFEVRNEFALGDPGLYRAAAPRKDDPKAVLERVAVAGLVGILRQLGDLAEFASDIFQDLHEQVMVTSVRGRKLLSRIQQLETSLPSLENRIRGQRSHLHFSYVAGAEWHSAPQIEQNHLLSSELPRFMIDSYEECQDPPRLYLLDKFDRAGAGACLKRYSDPSYFRRMWATSESEKSENIQKEKKSKKIKKNRSNMKVEGQFGRSLSHGHSSTQFTFPSIDEQRFSAEDSPISDMKLKPELASRSTSFGSRARLNFSDQIPDTSESVVLDELQRHILSDYNLQKSKDGSFSPDVCGKLNGPSTNNGSPHDAFVEESARRSSSVTWDEKTEIQKPESPISYEDILEDSTHFSGPLPGSSKHSNIVSEPTTTIHGVLLQENRTFTAANELASSSINHFDEITSEADNYMDALNTLESEAETDCECQTKRELNSFANNSPEIKKGTSQIQDTVYPSSVFPGAGTASGSQCSTNEDETPKIYNVVTPDSLEQVDFPRSAGSTPDQSHSSDDQIADLNSFEVPKTSGTEAVKNDHYSESSILTSPVLEPKTAVDMSRSTNTPANNSSATSVNFWTNGGLLGLLPSKPPDFSVSTLSGDNSTSGSVDAGYGHLNSLGEIKSSGIHLSTGISSQSPNFVEQAVGLPNVFSSQNILPTNTNSHCGHNTSVSRDPEFLSNNVSSKPNESGQITMDITSSISALAQRILANSLRRKQLIGTSQDEGVNANVTKPQETSFPNNQKEGLNAVVFEADHAEDINNIELMSSKTSSCSQLSGNSSPPLEHMKISFHPMIALENSQLHLEYACGNFNEQTDDLMFSSFQLLPGPSLPPESTVSETDDDTFSQSCSSTSEDHLSPDSDSNSEMWINDMSGEEHHQVYNDLHRISLSSSASFKESDQMNQINTAVGFESLKAENATMYIQNAMSGTLPGLASYVCTSDQRLSDSLYECFASQTQNELPPPPPLPPVQWRMMSPSFDKIEEKESSVAEIVEHFNVLQSQRSASPKQQEQNNPKTPHILVSVSCPNKKSEIGQKLNGNKEIRNYDVDKKQLDGKEELLNEIRNKGDQTKLNGQKDSNFPSAINQEVDEREELLYQIRNKSFNLRRTSTAKSSPVPESTTNQNVAAILEKANAIRQAFVGSDEGGDDDNWSD